MANARRTDPSTSHEAARSIRDVPLNQRAVFDVLGAFGPLIDEDLISHYDRSVVMWNNPQQSDSGIRTRRKELVDMGLVFDSGVKGRTEGGRASIRWEATRDPDAALNEAPTASQLKTTAAKERMAREHVIFVTAYTRIITRMRVLHDEAQEALNGPLDDGARLFNTGIVHAIDQIQAELDRPRSEQ